MTLFPNFPTIDAVFEEKYLIRAEIGRGSFSRIYRATTVDVNRDIALKILVPSHEQNHIDRFRREAKALANLRDPHTIRMFNFGQTEDGILFMVFEFVDGESLFQTIRREGAIHQTRALHIGRQVLASLHEAHQLRIVHRDIKPANVLRYDYFDERDRIKVIDFGIAKTMTRTQSGTDVTRKGLSVGTPRYMSPEQIMGLELGPSADIYSLGLMLVELMMGRHLISVGTFEEIVDAQMRDEPFEIPESAGVHATVRRILDRMIDKDSKRRYDSAFECMQEINALLATGTVSTTDAVPLFDPLTLEDTREVANEFT